MQLLGRLTPLIGGKGSSISASEANIGRPDINIVHVNRPLPLQDLRLERAVTEKVLRGREASVRYETTVHTETPMESAAKLVDGVIESLELKQAVVNDIVRVSQEFKSCLGLKQVNAKLEISKEAVCTKFHSDYVKLRCLCTYSGPGTEFIDHRYMELPDIVPQSSIAQQANPGDLLYLKGHHYPGSKQGFGAVHRSPLQGFNGPRLLLVVDDAVDCPCC